ncbi:MAG: xanthine dehydrogenase family protein [Chloroflexi bacterium]|nr:xanthine dehydrogenase family protein [Chloroflexota bacterium]
MKLGALEDRPIIARDFVRFMGEPVAAVAADTVGAAEEALDMIAVSYQELPAVFDVEEALKPNPEVVVHPGLNAAPSIRKAFGQGYAGQWASVNKERPNVLSFLRVRDGDTQKGFAESDVVVEGRYERARVAHGQLEPHAAVVQPNLDGGLTAWATCQVPYQLKETLCALFRLPSAKVRMIAPHQGGGFGGRTGPSMLAVSIAALLAVKTRKPVKFVNTREEMFIDGSTETPAIIYIRDGVKRDGTLVAREMTVIQNAGAYSGLMPMATLNVTFASTGTYRVPNFKAEIYTVYTNETPTGGPFRGYAAVGPQWAIESHMDVIAARLGVDSVEIRRRNILREGERDSLGQTVDNIALDDCITQVAGWLKWGEKPPTEDGPWKKGKGMAVCNKMTASRGFASVVIVKVHPDGGIEVRHSAVDLGQGCNTALTQIAAEEFATSVDKVKIITADTAITPYDFGTISNRTTWHTGNALINACRDARRQILERASAVLNATPENLYLSDGVVRRRARKDIALPLGDLFSKPGMYLASTGEILGRGVYVTPWCDPDPETGQGERLVAFYSYGADGVEVAVNVRTGEIKVLRASGCFDMGRVINPKIAEGQTEGGIGQGLGGALFEKVIINNGVVANPNLIDYRLPSMVEVPPDVKAMSAEANPHPEGPYGAKGFCEGSLIPLAPAVANAVYDAVGVRIVDLPITREKVLDALRKTKVKVTALV